MWLRLQEKVTVVCTIKEVKNWLHPAIKIPIDQETVHGTIQVFTDGSKTDQGVGAGIAVYRSGTHTKSLK